MEMMKAVVKYDNIAGATEIREMPVVKYFKFM